MVGKILVAIDASPAGAAALERAIGLGRDLGRTLVLVHVFQRPFMKAELEPEISVPVAVMQGPDKEAELEAADAELLATEWAGRVRAAGLAVETDTPRGHTADALVKAAERHGAEFIVMGTNARSGLSRLLGSSIAEEVVRRSDRPVVVVPHRTAPAFVPIVL